MKRLLGIYSLFLIVALACWPSIVVLHGLWTNHEARGNTHGYLVALITLILIFLARRELAAVEVRPHRPALLLVVLATLAWLVFLRAGLQDLHLLLLPFVLSSVVLATYGFATLRVLAFPLGFFVFALSIWEVLSSPLQTLTIHAQSVLIAITGLPAHIDGRFIHLPAGTFEIESGCSGLHFFVVGLAVAALYGELAKDSLKVRALWLALMGALALLSNWLRVFTIIVAGYFTDMQHYLVKVDHYRFGWILFGALMVVFLFLTSRYGPASRRTPSLKEERGVSAQPVSAAGWIASALAVLALPSFVYARELTRDDSQFSLALHWPAAHEPWVGPALAENTEWRPHFEGATASDLRAYRDDGGMTVEVFGVLYRHQRQNAELVGFSNALFGTDGALETVNESVTHLAASDWRETQLVNRTGHRSLVLWHYRIGERIFVQPMASQIWYGLTAIGRPRASALIAMRAECAPDCDSARARLKSFASANCSSKACGAIVERQGVVGRAQGKSLGSFPQVHAR